MAGSNIRLALKKLDYRIGDDLKEVDYIVDIIIALFDSDITNFFSQKIL